MGSTERPVAWDFAMAAPHSAPGVASMVGYRGLDVPDTVHLGLPSASLTFVLSLDEGVETADTQTGFSDQAHLNREFVPFSGLSPGAWSAGEFRNIQDGAHTPGAE